MTYKSIIKILTIVALSAIALSSAGCRGGCGESWQKVKGGWKKITGIFSSGEKKAQGPPQPECTKDSDCLKYKKRFCDGGKCVFCRDDRDCAQFEDKKFCLARASCVQCLDDRHCPVLEECRENECGRDSGREFILTLAVLVFALFIPIVQSSWVASKSEEARIKNLRLSLLTFSSGLILGIVTPVYLHLDPWHSLLLMTVCSAAAISSGLGGVAAFWLGRIGFALGFSTTAWALHLAIREYPALFGQNALYPKLAVIAFLLASTWFLIMSLDFQREGKRLDPKGSPETDTQKNIRHLFTALGAVLTVIEFIRIILDFIAMSPILPPVQ